MKDDCIFCKIANGMVPTHTLYEDDTFRVIFSLGQVSKGHALILPKNHYENIYELDDEVASKAFVLAKKMANDMKEKFGCDGFNVLQNNELAGGQSVFHFHMHLIPRYEGDKALIFGKENEADDAELAKLEELFNK